MRLLGSNELGHHIYLDLKWLKPQKGISILALYQLSKGTL